jgi:ribonuclease HI
MSGKYYAVRIGRSPGIYRTWAECEAQVAGFPGARFKGFRTMNGAEVFMQGGNDAPRHALGHERKRSRPKATAPERSPGRRPFSHADTGRPPIRNLYTGTRPPWEYPTFIRCIDEENPIG